MPNVLIQGKDALMLGQHINHMVEVFDASAKPAIWRPGRSFREVAGVVGRDPQLVRLSLDPRVLLEHVTKHGLPANYNMREVLATHRENHPAHIYAILERALGRV
jgi:hypothetical protein